MKRVEEEEKQKSHKKKLDEFVSDKAYEIIVKKLQKNDFIGERGFKKFISPFKEIIDIRGLYVSISHLDLLHW